MPNSSSSPSDEQYFLELSHELYCIVDIRTGELTTVRGAWTNCLGYAESELQGTSLWSLFHANDAETVRLAFEMTAEATETSRFNGRVRSKSGDDRLCEWTARAGKAEGTVIAVGRDVTEWHQLRQEAQLQKELMDQVARGAPVVISAYGRDGTILVHIGAGLKKLGLQENQLRGVSVYDAFRGAEEALGLIRDALAGKQATNTQTLGETVWDNWFSPMRNANGEITGAISISTDVTERDGARRTLEDRLQFIEEQGRAIRVMSAPIVEVWQGILVVPVVGQLNAESAADMMQRLLAMVVEKGASYTILELTAVEEIESTTAEHLLRMIQALELLGTRGLLSGIRPSVARALIEIGIDLGQVKSTSSLHAALRLCMVDESQARRRK